MSSNNPQQPQHSISADAPGLRPRNTLARLCLLLALAFAAPQASQSAPTPGQQQPPPPAPTSRPRTVNTNVAPASPTAAPAAAVTQQPPSDDPAKNGDADSQPSQEVDEDEVVRVVSNLVIIPATVVDARGRAIVDLRVEDFELRVDGEIKSIGDLSRSDTPVHVALLFDNSASLSAAREFEKQAAVRFFQSVVRPIDRAAVYSISTTPTLVQPLTNNVSRLVSTVERFGKPDGATALFDAIAQASDYMRPLTGRKVLVLVSDGTDTVSDMSFDDALGRALRAECQVYVVQTRQVEDPNLHDTFSEGRMNKLAEQTGGAVFVPRSIEELDYVFSQISLDLSQQYLLSYYPQDERTDKYFRFINLRVKTRQNMRVRARKGFYPHSAQGEAQTADARAQISTVPQNSAPQAQVASAPASLPTDAQNRRASAPTATAALRTGNANRKVGPDGPDDESGKPKADATDSAPTFTVTTVASVTTQETGATAEPKVAPQPAPTPFATPTTMLHPSAPAPVAATPAPSPRASAPTESQPATRSGEEKKSVQGNAEGAASKVVTGRAISLPKPSYPQTAKSSGAWGKVVVEVTIDENGKVVEARALSGHPLLQQSAINAARMAKFAPSLLAGKAVTVKGTISYSFALP